MKYKTIHPLIVVLIATAGGDQSASAQSARYDFAPQLWERERIRMPKHHRIEPAPVTSVSPDFLGVGELGQIVPAHQQTLPAVSGTRFQSQSEFGQPTISRRFVPPATMPTARNKPLMPAQIKMTSSRNKQTTKRTLLANAKMIPQSFQHAKTTIPVALYGNSIGYVPGQRLPSIESSINTAVSGKLLSPIQK